MFNYSSNSKRALAPNLQLLDDWKWVRNKNIDECTAILTRKSNEYYDSLDSNVEVSGLKVAGRFIYFIGPTVLFALIIYLLTLMLHLNSLISENGNASVAKNFPWLVLFNDDVSKNLTYFTILFYPVLVSTIILFNSEIPQPRLVITGLIYAMLFFGVSAAVFSSIESLKDKILIHSSVPKNEERHRIYPMHFLVSQPPYLVQGRIQRRELIAPVSNTPKRQRLDR